MHSTCFFCSSVCAIGAARPRTGPFFFFFFLLLTSFRSAVPMNRLPQDVCDYVSRKYIQFKSHKSHVWADLYTSFVSKLPKFTHKYPDLPDFVKRRLHSREALKEYMHAFWVRTLRSTQSFHLKVLSRASKAAFLLLCKASRLARRRRTL